MKLRTYLFMVALVSWWVLVYVIFCPLALLPAKYVVKVVQIWGKFTTCILLPLFGGIKTRVTGLENLPEGKFLVAAKHQSELETFVLGFSMPKPVFILKKELLDMPFFGWFVKKSGMIAVDRKAKGKVMQQMLDKAMPLVESGHQVMIFPEGTRVQVGQHKEFKAGIGVLYEKANVPVVPVALNTGLFWSGGKLHRTGTADVEFMKPIEPGLPLADFMERLEKTILERSEELNHKVLN